MMEWSCQQSIDRVPDVCTFKARQHLMDIWQTISRQPHSTFTFWPFSTLAIACHAVTPTLQCPLFSYIIKGTLPLTCHQTDGCSAPVTGCVTASKLKLLAWMWLILLNLSKCYGYEFRVVLKQWRTVKSSATQLTCAVYFFVWSKK